MQIRLIARAHLENVGSQFHSLRQPRRREISLVCFDVVRKPGFRGYFRANLWTSEPAINAAGVLSWPLSPNLWTAAIRYGFFKLLDQRNFSPGSVLFAELLAERGTSNANFISSFIGGSSNQVGAATRPYQRIIDDHREAARSLPSSYTTAEDLTAAPIPLSRDEGYHNPWAGPPLLAGDVAEAIVDGTAAALPPRDDLLTYLRLAKKDEHGNCDNCKISAMIVDVAPNASDDILADV